MNQIINLDEFCDLVKSSRLEKLYKRRPDIKKKHEDEKIKGGLADGKPDSKYNKKQIKDGTKVEYEHTNDKETAKEIAKDHLEEIPDYYTRLDKMEKEAKKKKKKIKKSDVISMDEFFEKAAGHKYIKKVEIAGKKARYFYKDDKDLHKELDKKKGRLSKLKRALIIAELRKKAPLSQDEAEGVAQYLIDKKHVDAGRASTGKDLIARYQKNKEIGSFKGKKSTKVPEKPVDTTKVDGPRKKAKSKLDEKYKEDFINARDSKFKHLGAEIHGSARERAYEWKSLQEAELDGHAEELVKRDKLLKNEPVDFITPAQEYPITALTMYLSIRKFPAKPTIDNHLANLKDDEYVHWTGNAWYSDSQVAVRPALSHEGAIKKTMTVKAYKKKLRKDYVDVFDIVKKSAERAASGKDFKDAVGDLKDTVKGQLERLRLENGYSPLANQLIKYNNKTLYMSPWGGLKKNSVLGELNNFTKLAKKEIGLEDLQYETEFVKERIMQVLEGDSINSVFGVKGEGRKKRYNPADLYVKHASRKGPKISQKTQKQQEKFLLKEVNLRGLQYGKTLTEDERKHHLEKVTEAFTDLTDAINLPIEIGSFNGRLGLALGARGKSSALAHYEPCEVAINLTRVNGVGSLAHEWWHFFDNISSKVMGEGQGYGSEAYFRNVGDDVPKINKAWENLQTELRGFVNRMTSEDDYYKFVGSQSSYYSSTREASARAFEIYLTHKLESKGRQNTYLTSLHKGANMLYPNKEENTKLTKAFDELFKEFKNSEYLKKALEYVARLKK